MAAPGKARKRVALTGAALCVLLGATTANAATMTAASKVPTVRLAQTPIGQILVARSGFTIFTFTGDRRNHSRCARIATCPTDWLALTTNVKPLAGPGLESWRLGTIPYRGKAMQVTYAGRPLYTYAFDYAPGSTMAVGNHQFGGNWYALTVSGQPLE